MSGIKIPKLNVPVGIYLISIIAIGAGEYYDLHLVLWAGIVSGGISLIVIICTMPAYIRNYIRNKNSTKTNDKS